MKKLIGIAILSLLLSTGSFAQHTELRFGSGGISGVPAMADIGDTLQLSFYLKNTGDVDFSDTIHFWAGTLDSSGMGLGVYQSYDMLTATIDVDDSVLVTTSLPLEASMFVPGVNITVVWPLLDQVNSWTTETDFIEINIDPTTFSTKEQLLQKLRIYPNPGKGDFTLDGPMDWSLPWEVWAISMEGRRFPVERDHDRIHMQDLAAGTYLIWLQFEDERYSFRLVLE